jgi:membrane-bound lytic murein transglycosylase D
LQAINGISRNKNLTLGQKILVPQAIGEIYAENTAHRKKQLQNYRSGVYIVRKGDTLSEIAKRHGTTVDQIKLWNDSDENLSIGQKLQLSRS